MREPWPPKREARRRRALFLVALFALIAGLVAIASPRMLGDSGDYVMMARNLGSLQRPSLSPDDLQWAATRYPGDVSTRLVIPQFTGQDGRQDLPHFWFYSLIAAPLVRACTAVGADPIRGFTALNLALLALMAVVLARSHSIPVVVLVTAGPILWWVDKAQTEVFTFSLLAIAVALLDTAPWWSIAALGAASTQNPPLVAAMALAVVSGVLAFGWRDRRLWLSVIVGGALAAGHPFYYWRRLGVFSTLRIGVDPHWPDLHEIVTPALDPNLGVFFHDFPLTLALASALVLVLSDPRRSPKRALTVSNAVVAAIGALLLVSFTQTTNVNSGGTPGPSRYGLWLIPLTLPVLATVADQAWLRALALVSLVWCGIQYAPARAEHYVSPSALAKVAWTRWPGLDNPVAEVFAERAAGREPSPNPPIAAAGGCTKILFEGTGAASLSLPNCPAVTGVPLECQPPGTYCYANRTGQDSWSIVHAATTPYWREIMARQKALAERPSVTLEAGWSFLERIGPAPTQPETSWRWMAGRAEARVATKWPLHAVMKLQVRAYNKPRRLRISVAGAPIAEFTVAESPRWYETPAFALPAGQTTFVLESLDGADRGPAPPGGEARQLAVALFAVEIVSAAR